MWRGVLWVGIVGLLAACAAQGGPVAAVVPSTASPPPLVTPAAPIRYAIAGNMAGLLPDEAVLRQSGLVEQLLETLPNASRAAEYDVVIAYGALDSWQQSPVVHTATLALNAQLAPFGDARVRDLFTAAMQGTGDPAATRRTWATLGAPDGLRLSLVYAPTYGLEAALERLSAYNIRLEALQRPVDSLWAQASQAHLTLFTWRNAEERAAWEQRFSAANLLDLYPIVISYQAADGLTLSFTPNGLPLASR